MVLQDNIAKLLDVEGARKGETFDLIYRGQSEIDRHYTKPMLPWIISEIKNQHKMLQVIVRIKDGIFEVSEEGSSKPFLQHAVKRIHKCVMEQADHRCFLYTVRPPEKDLGTLDTIDSSNAPIPSNISVNENYGCHLYQALTEQEVRSFFYCLRQQPRDLKLPDSDSFNSLSDLSVHTESQFFEVLFVGRVRISHCKVPVTFIDEALTAFRQQEKSRQRRSSGEGRCRSSPIGILNFQHDGSGYSVPDSVLRSTLFAKEPESLSKKSSASSFTAYSGSTFGEKVDTKEAKSSSEVQFHLWDTCDEGFPTGSLQPPLSSLLSKPLLDTQRELGREDGGGKNPDNSAYVALEPMLSNKSRLMSPLEPLNMYESSSAEDFALRGRAASVGGQGSINRLARPSDSDLKALGYDFNRTMLFHIGHREIQLINPELKSISLNKPFRDIAGCCQGIKCSDHFGFICQETSGEAFVYVGYIFKCDRTSVADEILQVLSRSFSAMHEAHQKDRKEHLMCDYCPLKWFAQLCGEVEGLPATKAHSTIMKRVVLLQEEDRESIIAKYEGAETSDVAHKNNVLMMLLRTHFEYRQSHHKHPSLSDLQKSDFTLGTNIGSSLKKAGKSISTSFSSLLRRDSEVVEKEAVRLSDNLSSQNVPVGSAIIPTSSTTSAAKSSLPAFAVVEGVSFSPLKPYRKRSCTVSGAEGASIRKELLSKKEEESKKTPCVQQPQPQETKMNIFMKFGAGPQSHTVDDDMVHNQQRPVTSFRHAILQKVVSPSKGSIIEIAASRKISQCLVDKRFQPRRSIDQLMLLWKKCIFQQILLLRIERENQRLRAIEHEEALQRVRLNYKEQLLPIEAQQTWELLLSRPQLHIDSNVLFSGIKQGVPKTLRGEIWNLLVIQHQLFGQSPHQDQRRNRYPAEYDAPYEALLKDLTSQQHAILIDIGRTFPCHPYFTQTLGPGQLALFNILKAYSILDPEVGYCQGLSFVGGVLLLHVEEEPAFQLLKHLMFEKGCRKQYRLDLEGLQIRMYQLSRLVHDKMLDLYNHLEEHEVTPQLYAAPWFLTLFASQFPINFVARVFDLLFLMGMEAVFCVALILLEIHKENLVALDSFEQIMNYFKSTATSIECDELNGFFSRVCDCNVRMELSAYEVEYQVLQEELSFSPQQNADIQKLKDAAKNLKRQNLDLLEQLQNGNNRQHTLETTNQCLQQSQHHLEVRVRWLEMERNNMKNLIQILSENALPDLLTKVPQNLERYLPNKASSPKYEECGRSPSPIERRRSPIRERQILSPPREISITVPRQHSFSPIKSINELVPEVSWPLKPASNVSDKPECHSSVARSSTLDPSAMQSYFSHIAGNR